MDFVGLDIPTEEPVLDDESAHTFALAQSLCRRLTEQHLRTFELCTGLDLEEPEEALFVASHALRVADVVTSDVDVVSQRALPDRKLIENLQRDTARLTESLDRAMRTRDTPAETEVFRLLAQLVGVGKLVFLEEQLKQLREACEAMAAGHHDTGGRKRQVRPTRAKLVQKYGWMFRLFLSATVKRFPTVSEHIFGVERLSLEDKDAVNAGAEWVGDRFASYHPNYISAVMLAADVNMSPKSVKRYVSEFDIEWINPPDFMKDNSPALSTERSRLDLSPISEILDVPCSSWLCNPRDREHCSAFHSRSMHAAQDTTTSATGRTFTPPRIRLWKGVVRERGYPGRHCRPVECSRSSSSSCHQQRKSRTWAIEVQTPQVGKVREGGPHQ